MITLAKTGWGWMLQALSRGEGWFVFRKHALYGSAVARIIYGLVVVVFVLANFARRDYLWGPASVWVKPIESLSAWPAPFTFFSSTDPGWLFSLKFVLLGAAGVALMLGWHTRIAAVVTLYLYVSLVTTNPVAGDQTDNAFRIILFYFVFADLSAHWSLDERRRSRRAAGGRPRTRNPLARRMPWAGTVLHNGAIVAVALQIFIIYVVAGLSKVKGSQWQDGTAVYYPLNLHSLTPWPWLSELATQNSLLVNIVTYFAVFIQLFFPFLLLARWTRVIALLGIVGMHAGIGVLMGLPLFSMAMMAADALFISDASYARVARYIRTQTVPWLRRTLRMPEPDAHRPGDPPAPAETAPAPELVRSR